MRIGIDIDDTLADTTPHVIPLYMEFDKKYAHGKGITKPHRKHNDAFDWTLEEIHNLRDNYIDDIVSSIPAKRDASKYVNLIKKLGHTIIIITARTKDYYRDPYGVSISWLKKNNIPFDDIKADLLYKGEVCIEAKIDLFIDDSFGQASYVAENLKIPVLMPVDDYNKDKECDGITKVNSWEEIYNIVFEKTNKN